jgi:predicted ATPase
LLAEAYLRSDNLERAAATIEQGLEHVRSTGERYFEAELIRLAGEVQLILEDDPQHAETSFREAVALARKQGAKSWEMRATQSLASLLQSAGRRREADKELAAITTKLERLERGRLQAGRS